MAKFTTAVRYSWKPGTVSVVQHYERRLPLLLLLAIAAMNNDVFSVFKNNRYREFYLTLCSAKMY